MPDIFDRIAPDQAPPAQPQGDIFDRVAAQMQPPAPNVPTAQAAPAAPADQPPQGAGANWNTPESSTYEFGTNVVKRTGNFLGNEGRLFAAGFERGARILGLDKSADYWRQQQPTYGEFQQKVEQAYPQTVAAQQSPHGVAAVSGMLGGMGAGTRRRRS